MEKKITYTPLPWEAKGGHNGPLMAAAPELYEALKGMIKAMGHGGGNKNCPKCQAVQKALTAINKAEGRK